MILWALFLLGVSLTVVAYLRNKQWDRQRHRRERLHEKQEEMLESIRKKAAEQAENDKTGE
jgi:hypothetical protein